MATHDLQHASAGHVFDSCRQLTSLGLVVVALALAQIGCSDDDATPLSGGASGTGGTGGAGTCPIGTPLEDGSCVSPGIPDGQCFTGFKSDGQRGCEPILPDGDCPNGSIPVIGDTTCQVVGVPADQCGQGFQSDGHSGCQPILPAQDCPSGTIPVLGMTACQPVGIPSGMGLTCSAGFAPSDGGCEPLLPASDCPVGQMALPGETQCHEPQACGNGTWGDIPVDASTQHVDITYLGGASDGSALKPWTSITEALSHAAPGAVVAVAAGEYNESLTITQGVKLWGVCPSKAHLNGLAADSTLRVDVLPAGQSVEVHGLGISGASTVVYVLGATGVTLDGLWIHDGGAESYAVLVQDSAGAASVVLRSSLIENNHLTAVTSFGSTLSIEDSVIRGTQARASDNMFGYGVQARANNGLSSSVSLSRAIVEQNSAIGVYVSGSDFTAQGVVVRNTQPTAADQGSGYGIYVTHDDAVRGKLTLTSSLVDNNRLAAIAVSGSEASIENTVLRNTLGRASDGKYGYGLYLANDEGNACEVAISSSLIDQNHGVGALAFGTDLNVENCLIRNTLAQSSDSTLGRGILLQDYNGVRGSLTMISSQVEGNIEHGVFLGGADGTIQRSIIRDTKPSVVGHVMGRGIEVLDDAGVRASLTLSDSLIEKNHETGVAVLGSDAVVQGTVVRNTQPDQSDMSIGRGLSVQNDGDERGILNVVSSVIEQNFERGIVVAGSDAVVRDTLIRDTMPEVSSMMFGGAIGVQLNDSQRGNLLLVGSVLDHNSSISLYVESSDVAVERSVIRDTQPEASTMGLGLGIQALARDGVRSTVSVQSSLLEKNHYVGIGASSTDLIVRNSVVRDTQPRALGMIGGDGIVMQSSEGGRGNVNVSGSLLDGNHGSGLTVTAADGHVTGSVLRNTQCWVLDGEFGFGIGVQNNLGERGKVSVSGSILEGNHTAGIGVAGAEAIVEGSVIRNTLPIVADMTVGMGIGVQYTEGERGLLTLVGSVISENVGASVFVSGSDATIERTVIRDTLPIANGTLGQGLAIQYVDDQRSSLALKSSLIDRSLQFGLVILGSDATVSSTLIRDTRLREVDQTFGDGIAALLSKVDVSSTVIEGSARAGMSNFGSELSMRDSVVVCADILFDEEVQSIEPFEETPITPVKGVYTTSNIACGSCDVAPIVCEVVSSKLTPPGAVPALKQSPPATE